MTEKLKSPTRMSKKELNDTLTSFGYTKEQLLDSEGNCLKRQGLVDKLNAHYKGEEGLEILPHVEINDDSVITPDTNITDNDNQVCVAKNDEETKMEQEPPTQNDPQWTQYVIGKFMDDEIDGKNPRVEGLRRVANQLVGELIEEGCDLVASPTEENRFRACAKAWGVFLTPDGIQKRFEALADAHSENCFEDYATYLVAMADTRAKGRMFRNALCLRRVVSAEEVSKTMAMSTDIQQGGPIHVGQISMIRLIAQRHNFDIQKILDDLAIQYEVNDRTGDVNLQKLSYEDALSTAKKMREMREEKENK